MQHMNHEEYLESQKPQMMVLDFSYDYKIILTYDDGVNILNALKRAEEYKSSYSIKTEINLLTKYPDISLMSRDEYKKIKMENLILGKTDEE